MDWKRKAISDLKHYGLLKKSLVRTKKEDSIEYALSQLTKDERLVLDKFIINRTEFCIYECEDELHYKRSKLYELRNKALYKFATFMYGDIE